MQKTLIFLVAVFTISAFASITLNIEDLKSLWTSWKITHGKAYSRGEETARFAIFEENYKKIIKFNAAHEDVKLGLTKFADLTATEFKTIHVTGYTPRQGGYEDYETNKCTKEVGDLPASVDWRTKGAVQPVTDVGQCGAAWIPSTLDVLESFYFINHGKLLSFSGQQIIDCDTDGSGCEGGDIVQALSYTAANGIELAATYPVTGSGCKYVKALAIEVNHGVDHVTPNDTNSLKTVLVNQPVEVVIEADESVFQLYTSGVIKSDCGANVDHVVLAVGYDTFNGDEAFILKNYWGIGWGQNGYVYISTDGSANGGAGVCGILSQPVTPFLYC